MGDADIHRGLAGVVADSTAISSVNPETNSLLYRGYPAPELAERCGVEEVAFLLWNGELPNGEQRAEFARLERAMRPLDSRVRTVIDALPAGAHPMDTLRTAVSALGANDPTLTDAASLVDPTLNLGRSASLLAQLPTIVAYDQRRRRGLEPIEPDPELGYAENFLAMTFGEVPEPVVVDAFRTSLVLYAEHSFNASTFTARVVASTLSDVYSAVAAALGALKGPLHGGANEAVMRAFEEIGSAEHVEQWLEEALASGRKIMGFGHRVYKNGDSRVPTMRRALERVARFAERPDLLALYSGLEEAMGERKNIKPNLDYPSGPLYHLIGFDTETFTPLFAAARVAGWTAHVLEQLAHNTLIRPLSVYDGPAERHLS